MLNRIPHMENSRSIERGVEQPSKGVFVGDLSSFCAEKDLFDLFAPFGRISAIEIKRGRHGDSLLHGFVEYESEQAVLAAIEGMNGYKHRGRHMRVNKTNMKLPPLPEAETWVQVQVHFVTKNINMQVCEEFLETAFAHVGTILDVIVKRHLICTDPPQISGYGFVFFEDMNAAVRAIATMKGVTVKGVHFDCQFGTPKREDRKHTFHGPSFGVVTPQLLQQMQQQQQLQQQAQSHLPTTSINYNHHLHNNNTLDNNNPNTVSYHPSTSQTAPLSLQHPQSTNSNTMIASGLLPAPLTIPATSNVSSTASSTSSTPHHIPSPHSHLLQHHPSPSHLKTATSSPSNAIFQMNKNNNNITIKNNASSFNNNLSNNNINMTNHHRSLSVSNPQHMIPAHDSVSTSPRTPSQQFPNQQQYMVSDASMMWKHPSVVVPPTLHPPQQAPQPRIYSNNIPMNANINNHNNVQSGNMNTFQKEFLMEKEFVSHPNNTIINNNNNHVNPASYEGNMRERVSSMDILPSPPVPSYSHHVQNNSSQTSNVNINNTIFNNTNSNINNNMMLSERLLVLSRSENWLSEAMPPYLNMDARLPPSLNSASRSNINYPQMSNLSMEDSNNSNNINSNGANKSSLFSLMARSDSIDDSHLPHPTTNNNTTNTNTNTMLLAKGLSLASLSMSRDDFISPVPSSSSISQINTSHSHSQQLPSLNTMELSSLSSSSLCSIFSSSNNNNNTSNMRYLHNVHHPNHPLLSPSSTSSTPSHRHHIHHNVHIHNTNNNNINSNNFHQQQGFLLASLSSGLQSPSVGTNATTDNDILLTSFSQGASFSRSFSSSYDKWHTPSSLSSTSRTVYMNNNINSTINTLVHNINNASMNKNNINIMNDHCCDNPIDLNSSHFEDNNGHSNKTNTAMMIQDAWHQQRDRALFVLTPSPEPWMKEGQEKVVEKEAIAKEAIAKETEVSMNNITYNITDDSNNTHEQVNIEDFDSFTLSIGQRMSELREEDANHNANTNNNAIIANQSLNVPLGLIPSIAMASFANVNFRVQPTVNKSNHSSNNSLIYKPHAVSAQSQLQEHYFIVQPKEDT